MTDDNRSVVVRYRSGYLSVMVHDVLIYDGFVGEELPIPDDLKEAYETLGMKRSLDGYMTLNELKKHTGHLVEWPDNDYSGMDDT